MQLSPVVVVIKDPVLVGKGSMRSVVFRCLSVVVLQNLDVICWLFGDALCHFSNAPP